MYVRPTYVRVSDSCDLKAHWKMEKVANVGSSCRATMGSACVEVGGGEGVVMGREVSPTGWRRAYHSLIFPPNLLLIPHNSHVPSSNTIEGVGGMVS